MSRRVAGERGGTGAGSAGAHRARQQYATTDRLAAREQVWRPGPDGRSPRARAVELLVAARPRRVLDVGCGTGAVAAALVGHGLEVIGADASPAMARATRDRGAPSLVASVAALPFPAATFDAVAALWMLYHAPSIDAALAEVARVLAPGGLLVVATNGAAHTRDLFALVDREPPALSFTAENAGGFLARHLDAVRREDIATRAVMTRAQAAAYLESTGCAADGLPAWEGTRTFTGATAVLTARAPR